jgi:hypothetical protein
MAESNVHVSKRKKNIAVFALILIWCLLIFLVTMVKLARAADDPYDMSRKFLDQRTTHQKEMEEQKESYDHHGAEKYLPEYNAAAQKMEDEGERHGQEMSVERESYDRHWTEKYGPEYEAATEKMETQGVKHRDEMEGNPDRWWENWEDKLNPEK